MILSPSLLDDARWVKLSSKARLVYLALSVRADKGGKCFPSIATISIDCGIKRNTATAAVAELLGTGLVCREKRFSASSIYIVQWPISIQNGTSAERDTNGENDANLPISIQNGTSAERDTLTGNSKPIVGTAPDHIEKPTPQPPIVVDPPKPPQPPRATFGDESPEMWLASQLWANIAESGTKMKPPNLQQWARDIDLMHRVDKRPYDMIRIIMGRARRDKFWAQNARCPGKIREQMNRGNFDRFAPMDDDYMTDADFITTMREVINVPC